MSIPHRTRTRYVNPLLKAMKVPAHLSKEIGFLKESKQGTERGDGAVYHMILVVPESEKDFPLPELARKKRRSEKSKVARFYMREGSTYILTEKEGVVVGIMEAEFPEYFLKTQSRAGGEGVILYVNVGAKDFREVGREVFPKMEVF